MKTILVVCLLLAPSAVFASPYGYPEPVRVCHPETVCTYGQCRTIQVCQ